MKRCKWCGQSKWLGLSRERGLCKRCESVVEADVALREKRIKRALVAMDLASNVDVVVAHCNVILQNAEALLKYERKGIPTVSPSPSQIIHSVKARKDALLADVVRREVRGAQHRAQAAFDPRTKVEILAEAFVKVKGVRAKFTNDRVVDASLAELSRRIRELSP
ncbi:MAG: hypothetical protein Kow0092_04340 [Deferrisomatales bacterium]